MGVRSRRIARTALWNIFARAFSVLTTFVSIRLVLSHLGVERFGLWATITSLAGVAGALDFGIGNGMMNRIVGSNQRSDTDETQETILTAFWLSLAFSSLIGVAFALAYPWISWERLLKLSSPALISDIGPTISIFAVCICVGVPLNLIASIQLGMQQGHVTSRWQSLGQISTLIMIFVAANLGFGLRWFTAVTLGVPLLASIGSWFEFYIKWNVALMQRPRLRRFNADLAANLFRESSIFFLLQIVAIGVFGVDLVLIAAIVGPKQVADYAIAQRYFSIVPVIFSLLLAPLWPAYRDAVLGGDVSWLSATLKRSVIATTLLSVLIVLVLLLFLHSLLPIWLGKNIEFSKVLLIGLAIFAVLQSVGNALAMFLNAVSVMRLQLVLASLFGVASVVAKIVVLHTWGIRSLPWAGIVSFTLLDLVPVLVLMPNILAKVRRSM